MAVPADEEIRKLLEEFVCVRVVQMWGLDRTRFQFDNSLTWSVFLMNADGTLYGRYGSRSGLRDKSDDAISLEGFKKTLRGTLELHDRYQRNPKEVGKALAAKTGPEPTWKTPEAIPDLKNNPRFSSRFTGTRSKTQNCIHCHMIHTSEVPSLRAAGKEIPDRMFWPYPMPDEVGLRMDTGEIATVLSVAPDSIASRSGFKSGDRILTIKGQPILSTADIQWVLHWAEDPETIELRIDRSDKPRTLELALTPGWRRGIEDWRWINMGLQRKLIPLTCKSLLPKERAERKLKEGSLGLRVMGITRGWEKKYNLKKGDLIVAVDGRRNPMNIGAFTAYLFRRKAAGDSIALTLLRGGTEHRIDVEVQ